MKTVTSISGDRVYSSGRAFSELSGVFLQSLAVPSDDRPTVRCVSRNDALSLVIKARDAIGDPQLRGQAAARLLDLLEQSGVLQPLPLTEKGAKNVDLYAVGPQSVETLDPLELLGAMQPAGVACYFTALQYYGLTTQVPTHHHIAKLVSRSSAPAALRATAPPNLQKSRRDPLGTLLFTYQSVPYYQTSRGTHTLAGVQLRQINDRSLTRITTREQTLLDTLHRPLSCGGLSIVWEAWQSGIAELNEQLLVQHLQSLNDSKLMRRVAYMLSVAGHTPGPLLQSMLDEVRRALDLELPPALLPLFPGLQGVGIDRTWQLELPVL